MVNFLQVENFIETVEEEPVSALRKWGVLLVLSLALAIVILDTTILNVSLAAIVRDLQTSVQNIQWVISAYSLTLAALTVTGGRFGDIFGRKKMFMLGAFLFAVGSFLASMSHSVGMLIIGESLVEGVGAALMMPATSSLLIENYVGRDRAIAFGVWGGIAGAAAALGPIIGGYLTTTFDWRWGFRLNLIVISALLIGSLIIPASKRSEERPDLDWLGVLLSSFGLLTLVFSVIEASSYGWWTAKKIFEIGTFSLPMPWNLSVVPFSMVLGLLILTLFIGWELYHEGRGRTPLISLKIFQNRAFTSGILTMSVMALGQTGLIFSVPVFLQSVRHLDAFHTGLSLLPMSLLLLVVSPLSAMLGRKVEPKHLVQLGLLVTASAYLVLRQMLTVDSGPWQLAPGLALFGIGMGLVMSQISNMTLSAVSSKDAGEASGINSTMRQVGASFGSAIIGSILISVLSTSLATGVTNSQILPEAMKPVLTQQFSDNVSEVEFGNEKQQGNEIPVVIREEIAHIAAESTVEANRAAMAFGAGFTMLGFLVSFALPKRAKEDEEEEIEEMIELGLVSQTEIDNQPSPVHTRLTIDLIGELILIEQARLERGYPSIHAEVRALVDRLKA
ncbi:hypothetical protein COX00_04300 [Candidatus Uhrbacteria bacterium CG22_combo_CG10-13_8_21_14_all_47_17]|uniref:Major facilitator superfamily (MFS) profile domain-containing protein n=1 Tax=Candidatus Uhrbacteria bacterium CG22_combo_CG10-13_8_21_14_all_47_17 TaxID=1975041 RepID=A0A2H0BRU4_9BACT|nr:MAG: hypothetical protein COX00_04300 [Candidatus Uhrbacteria bacterium CG22_combo_CG10-13_8_21_14_all_47_17]